VPWDYWFGSYAGSEEDYVARFGSASKANFVFHAGDSIADVMKEVKTLDTAEAPPSSGAGSRSDGRAKRPSSRRQPKQA
jgi:hypothetical protein